MRIPLTRMSSPDKIDWMGGSLTNISAPAKSREVETG